MGNRYQGKDKAGRSKGIYLKTLTRLSDDEYIKEATHIIGLAARAHDPSSDSHWQAQACYDEAERRRRMDLYNIAYHKAKHDQ